MNIFANENVFDPIIGFLRSQGHRVISVREAGLSGISDDAIYQKAVSEGLVILTMDKDFANMLRFPPERCGGIIVIKIYRHTVDETTELFKRHFNALSPELASGRLTIISSDKVRIKPI